MNNKHLNVSKSALSARENKDWYYSKKYVQNATQMKFTKIQNYV